MFALGLAALQAAHLHRARIEVGVNRQARGCDPLEVEVREDLAHAIEVAKVERVDRPVVRGDEAGDFFREQVVLRIVQQVLLGETKRASGRTKGIAYDMGS